MVYSDLWKSDVGLFLSISHVIEDTRVRMEVVAESTEKIACNSAPSASQSVQRFC